jgi:hypothetical protein
MIRAVLLVLLPIALPILLYFGYLKFLKRPAAAGQTEETEWARQRILFAVVLATAALAIAAFAYLRLSDSLPAGTRLQAPKLIDGKIVPSRPIE